MSKFSHQNADFFGNHNSILHNIKKIACAVLFVVLFCGLLSSCDEPKEVDTSNMYLVTYIGNGGLFEGARTMREIYYEKNSLINMPTLSMTGSEISISSMGKITRRGYNLAGWYTSEKVSYYADENGEYVKVDSYYERKNDGKFVLIYVRDDNGTYALKVSEKENADGVLERSEEYVLYNPTDKSLEGCERYEEKFVEYNKEYSDLLRYECVTENAYAIVTDMFMPRFDGKYIKNEDETYSFIGDKNYDGQRYTLSPYFVTSATDVISLDRYKAEFIYNEADRWDFNNTRMPEQNVVLYANWQPALTATYVYWDDSSFSVYSNTIGAPITKPTGTAKDGNGRTFIGWSREKDKYVPWNFESDVYPDNVEGNVLKLYAHYAQGDYIRITNADELKEIGKYPEQSFMLCNDINLEGTMGHPMGFTKNVLFTGTFEGNGFAISNFKITANNKLLEPAPFALFNQTKNATIKNLKFSGTVSVSGMTMNSVIIGSLIGKDEGGSKILDCTGDITFTVSGTDIPKVDIIYGSAVGKKSSDTIVTNANITVDKQQLQTSGVLTCSD